MVGDVLKNLVIGLIALVLIVAGGFYIKKYQENEETVGDVQEVKWDVSTGKGNEKVDIVFQLLNKKNNEIRGVNDQIRAVIVDGQLKHIQQIKPTFAGNGSYKLSSKIAKDEEYTIFLYEDKNKSVESFARKDFGRTKEENNKKKVKFPIDSVLTKKIGEYEVSLLFGALHPNEPVTLTFQFQAKKGEKLKLHSERGEVESLYIVDETKENFLYAMPVDTDEQLQYRITFPAEGTYKMWGNFYINGKKYEKEFIVQVQKRKNS
ncbi:hypothetical protein [Bacillus thuringiensis]|uniref:Uncharacterized protein n=1 Tax=Bacillus thuringiensis serovar toumanoffi TaxID=180862 RepID=A0ABD5HWZ2_BACTU|nr:hypothetical protein [Bacillus thuringiensis]EEM97209.1 hypothetical protein bthur0013_13650 [Bacillus thuringiensis IBL 200]MCR6779445.1 hypothetical protein [Bacillus thuringiensis]MCR6857513.1 hypothetical protein [Bacillus thuringiensis]MCR6867270.1 hypothetical protein [Bacillus thuringiensis]MDW9209461.1 hypothetical protein [Bacillus thuringiensis serovar toumanoffi]